MKELSFSVLWPQRKWTIRIRIPDLVWRLASVFQPRALANIDLNSMTRRELLSVPMAEWSEEMRCNSFVIVPAKRKHDSNYQCFWLVLIGKDSKPFVKVGGCSDALHFDGIGGYGYRWLEKMQGPITNTRLAAIAADVQDMIRQGAVRPALPEELPIRAWMADCLWRSGCLRFWCRYKTIITGCSLSSMEIYALTDEEAEVMEGKTKP